MTGDADKGLGLGVVALPLLLVACCAGLPLLVAAGVSVALAAWVGGIALGGVGLVPVAAVLVVRMRRRGGSKYSPLPITPSRL